MYKTFDDADPRASPDKKKEIKSYLRQSLKQNTRLSSFLEKNHVTGRFIKSTTNRCMKKVYQNGYTINDVKTHINNIMYSWSPIDSAIHWADTSEGHEFWRKLNEKYHNED